MNNTVKSILIFAFGAAVGSAVAWKLTKTKYEQIAQEEIDSVKEVYSKKKDKQEVEDTTLEFTAEDIKDYHKIISDNKYDNEKGGSEDMKDSKPFIIPPEDFGNDDDYDQISLIYYEDDVLTDDMNNPIEDIENTVGLGFDTHFGEYEDDSVFVQNDKFKCYYEILRDYGKYSDQKVDE